MKATEIYSDSTHRWTMLGRDSSKPDRIIDTNQYLIHSNAGAIILDPGGIELFAPMLEALVKIVPLQH